MQEHIDKNRLTNTEKTLASPAIVQTGNDDHCRNHHKVRRICAFSVRISRMGRNLRNINQTIGRQYSDMANHLSMVRNCQEETARLVNGELERHALRPAVETAVILADELNRLEQLAVKLAITSHSDLGQLFDEIKISGQIARDKLEYLDITKIEPSRVDTLDHRFHTVVAAEKTSDSSLHGLISATIMPGMIYRGKVFKSAKVSVFKHELPDNDQENHAVANK